MSERERETERETDMERGGRREKEVCLVKGPEPLEILRMLSPAGGAGGITSVTLSAHRERLLESLD